MDYCKRCVYPVNARPGIVLDAEGVCSGCRLIESRPQIDWDGREKMLIEILESTSPGSAPKAILTIASCRFRAERIPRSKPG
jgi:hypothetical protein